jgi:lipopolysaccharide/colanic/teichoic acid biosynthesis glycosyltransferase
MYRKRVGIRGRTSGRVTVARHPFRRFIEGHAAPATPTRTPNHEPEDSLPMAETVEKSSRTRTAAARARASRVDWRLADSTKPRVSGSRYPLLLRVTMRLVEYVVAATALILSLPLLVVLAILIRLDSPGPAIFVQPRLGRGAKLFRFVKFRTMYADARERFPELYRYTYTPEQVDVLKFKVVDDPRVTRVGRWLRKTSLDELPNFWNVLTGDVALVGPRPEIPEMLPYYTPDELRKFDVRPGITGYAQVAGRGHLKFRDTLRLDIAYVDERSFGVDLRVILRTLRMIVVRHGAF